MDKSILTNALNNPDIVVEIEGQTTTSQQESCQCCKNTMTQTERRFAVEILEPAIQSGDIVFWLFEPQEIRMSGQSYTPDFMALWSNGIVKFYEIKGIQKLGSQDRSSVKIRWASSQFGSDSIEFYWFKWTGDKWRSRKITPKRKPHSQLKK